MLARAMAPYARIHVIRPAAHKMPGIAPGQAVVDLLISVSNGTPRAR